MNFIVNLISTSAVVYSFWHGAKVYSEISEGKLSDIPLKFDFFGEPHQMLQAEYGILVYVVLVGIVGLICWLASFATRGAPVTEKEKSNHRALMITRASLTFASVVLAYCQTVAIDIARGKVKRMEPIIVWCMIGGFVLVSGGILIMTRAKTKTE